MSWAAAAKAVADSVSAVANTISAYGPNDEAKAVKAADKAGDNAKKLVKKQYPKCETELEYKKKIVPLNLDGVTSRAVYNNLRAKKIEEAYKQAYDEVISLYRQRLTNEINQQSTQNAQESFNSQVESDFAQQNINNELKSTGASGCLGISAILITSASLLTYLTYYFLTI